jgi:signal transduction histidine kinase
METRERPDRARQRRERRGKNVEGGREIVKSVTAKVASQLPVAANANQDSTAPGAKSALYDLLAMVLHEMRAPLGTLTVTVELLVGSLDEMGAVESQAMLQRIQRSTSWLQALVENLTVAAQLEASQLQVRWRVVDLSDCLDLAMSIAQPSLDRERQLVVVEGLAGTWVAGDQRQIEQILVNLLMNASKYGGPNSKIRVGAKAVGKHVRIEVRDEGPGIPTSEQETIFGRYVRGSTADSKGASGLGLGLHIVKTLVELHGGAVGLESEEGNGATFWFTVPAVDDARLKPGQPWTKFGR